MSIRLLGTTPFRDSDSTLVFANESARRPRDLGHTRLEESPDSTEQRWWLTATHGDVRDSATENRPPAAHFRVSAGKGETVR